MRKYLPIHIEMNKLILSVIFSFAINGAILAQSNCPPQNLYITNFLSDGIDSSRLKFPLKFCITTDSIIISYASVNRQFAAFRVLNKACFWNEDFSEGKSEYKLMLYDVRGNKQPTLNIIINKKQPMYIELLYENSEKRVFTQF